MALLSRLWRLNFHPLHLAHFVAAAFALSLFRQDSCYLLAEKNSSEKRRLGELLHLWTESNDTWQYEWQQRDAGGATTQDVSPDM